MQCSRICTGSAFVGTKDRMWVGHSVLILKAQRRDHYTQVWKQLLERGLPVSLHVFAP